MSSTYARSTRLANSRLPYVDENASPISDLLPADQQCTLSDLVATLPPRNPITHSPTATLLDTMLIVEHGKYEPSGTDIATAVEILGSLLARKFQSSGVVGVRNTLSSRAHDILCQAAAIGHS